MSQPPSARPDMSSPPSEMTSQARKRSARSVILAFMQSAGIFICVLVAAIALAIGGGIFAGQKEKGIRATATTSAEIQIQYGLAQQDILQGKYVIAAQRLRWIVQTDNNFPGAADALTQVESLLNITPTAPSTAAPLNTAASPDDLFTQAQQAYTAQDWVSAIRLLQELQASFGDFRSAEVGEMLYRSLVTLGLQYVRADRLEEGVFLLEQAKHIRPLDDQSGGELSLARLYLTGRAYSGLNWGIAIKNFEAIYTIVPDYRDVKERLYAAYVTFADQLVAAGGHCDAATFYDNAQKIKASDEIKSKFDAATAQCAIPTAIPLPGTGTAIPGTPGTPGAAGVTPSAATPSAAP